MSGVFISYRREDSGGYAGRLFDILSLHYGRENIFMDLDAIRGGDDFVTVIEEKVGQCDVLLAIIGERWLTITGENGVRRLDSADDFVRLEIARALERGVRVIPVLVSKGTMPGQADLPEDLRALSHHEAIDLRDEHFRDDANRLIQQIDPSITHRPWKVKSSRFAPAIAGLLVVAAVGGGILLYKQFKLPAPGGSAPVTQSHDTPAESAAGSIPVDKSKMPADKSKMPLNAPTDFNGKWKATVTYDWPDAIYPETFNFQVDGTDLSGTASLLETDRGILEGKIAGDHISFTTKSLTDLDDKTYQDRHTYKGILKGDTIQFTMMTDSEAEEHVPIHFIAKRSGAR